MSRPGLPLVAASLAAAVCAAGTAARAEIYGTTFRSPVYGVEMTLPRGWEISEQASYPGVLARGYEHRTHTRMTLAVQALAPGETAKAYLTRNEKTLRRLGYDVAPIASRGSNTFIIEMRTPDKRRVERQAYVAQGENVFILSMATDASAATTYVRPFEETLRSLSFTAAPAGPTSAPSAPPASQPSESPKP